ncbi:MULTISPECIES: hypothetical protein [unclassified Spirillospora]|uniref:hypothetical protein n=1 Tax=unclassified Spirillospora TaxID=2642701 RepID=UPI00371D18FD
MCRWILHRTCLDQYIPVTATLDRAITGLTSRNAPRRDPGNPWSGHFHATTADIHIH